MLKKMGFSFEEMGLFTMDDFFDLVEIYIESLGSPKEDKNEIYDASQNEIDAFFK